MKTLITLLLLSLTISLSAQSVICFPREKQADRQTARLNTVHYKYVWDMSIQDWELKFKHYYKTDSGYCIDINCEDSEITYGYNGKRLAIKKRHYKYISSPQKQFFNLDDCYLRHDKSKFQRFMSKLRK